MDSKRLILVFVSLGLSLRLNAVTRASEPFLPAVSGTILDARTHQPILGARVTVRDARGALVPDEFSTGVSAADGRVQLPARYRYASTLHGLEGGERFAVRVTKPGYREFDLAGLRPGPPSTPIAFAAALQPVALNR